MQLFYEINNCCVCLLDRGTVFAVGCNVNGQLGLGTQCPTVLTPTRVSWFFKFHVTSMCFLVTLLFNFIKGSCI